MNELLQFTITGAVLGAVYAIAAGGLVLTYTTTGVFNFAHGAVGGLAAYVHWWLSDDVGLPVGLSALLVVAASPLLGVALERAVFRRFRRAPVETTIVLTVALTLLLIGVTNQLFDPTVPRRLSSLFGDGSVELAGVTVTHDELAIVAVAVAVAVGLRVLLYRTRLGVTMRAVVDDPDLAAYAGARSTRIAQASWAVGFGLAGLSGVLFATGRPIQILVLSFLVLNAYAAAIVGRLRSLPLTFAGAIGLGVLQELSNVSFLWPTGELWGRARLAIPGVFLFLVVLAVPGARLRVGRVAGRDEHRPPSLRGTLARAAAGVATVAVLADVLPDGRVPTLSRAVVFAVVLLSLVLVTGYGGQITLATYVFMALGAWAVGDLVAGGNVLGLAVAALVAAPIGALVALPALRLQGLYLALTTFAFALAAQYLVVGDQRIFGSGALEVDRPRIGPVDTSGDAAFAVAAACVLAALAVGILAVRRGRYGRRLAAIRDSEVACATLGLDVRASKVVVCAASAAIAGIGGALYGAQSIVVGDVNFEPVNNLIVFMFAVVGGITTVTGAVIGGVLYAVMIEAQTQEPRIAGLAFALVGAAAVALGRQPNGLAGMLLARWRRRARPTTDRPSRSAAAATAPDALVPQGAAS